MTGPHWNTSEEELLISCMKKEMNPKEITSLFKENSEVNDNIRPRSTDSIYSKLNKLKKCGGERANRGWDPGEEAKLMKMYTKTNMTHEEMANVLGRSKQAIYSRVHDLGLPKSCGGPGRPNDQDKVDPQKIDIDRVNTRDVQASLTSGRLGLQPADQCEGEEGSSEGTHRGPRDILNKVRVMKEDYFNGGGS